MNKVKLLLVAALMVSGSFMSRTQQRQCAALQMDRFRLVITTAIKFLTPRFLRLVNWVATSVVFGLGANHSKFRILAEQTCGENIFLKESLK